MSTRPSALTYWAIGLGGSLGAGLRVAWLEAEQGDAIVSLLAVNGLGCALIGLIWRFSEPGRRKLLPAWCSMALMSGLCGALTSYSTAIVILMERVGVWGWPTMLALLTGSAACWVVAALIGMAFGHMLNPEVK